MFFFYIHWYVGEKKKFLFNECVIIIFYNLQLPILSDQKIIMSNKEFMMFLVRYYLAVEGDKVENCSGSALVGAGGSVAEDTVSVRAGVNR